MQTFNCLNCNCGGRTRHCIFYYTMSILLFYSIVLIILIYLFFLKLQTCPFTKRNFNLAIDKFSRYSKEINHLYATI
jgi:hypothetical protein